MINPTLIYDPTCQPVARALVSAGAYLIRSVETEEQFFTWKSGIQAPVYTDCRMLNANPGARAVVMRALGSSIRSNFPKCECIVGVAEAGIVWSSLAAHELSLPHAFVRKQEKKHGRAGLLVGSPPAGAKAVVVDDLVASGASVEKTIHALREEQGIQTIGLQSIVNWDFIEMRDRFKRLAVPVRALVSFPQLLSVGKERGLLSSAAAEELSTFYRSPRNHKWNLEALTRRGGQQRAS